MATAMVMVKATVMVMETATVKGTVREKVTGRPHLP
jgi:hypothetical protein